METRALIRYLLSLLLAAGILVTAGSVLGQNKEKTRPTTEREKKEDLRLTPEDAAETPQEKSAAKKCEVTYILDTAGTITTGWIDLGTVSFPNRRQKCKNRAIANCQHAKAKLTTYAPVGSANMQAICDQGELRGVYFDTRIGNLKYTKDGNCSTAVGCTRPPCPWTGYQ